MMTCQSHTRSLLVREGVSIAAVHRLRRRKKLARSVRRSLMTTRRQFVVSPDLADDGCQGRPRTRCSPKWHKTVLFTRKVMTVMEILHAVRYLY